MLALVATLLAASAAPALTKVAPGIEHGTLLLADKPSAGDGLLHVVRLDPRVVTIDLALASEGSASSTAAQPASAWADHARFRVVINAGMYEPDQRTNVGRLQHGAHVNNTRWKPSFKSVLLLEPKEKGLPSAELVDRDAPGFDARAAKFNSMVQNLRLIKGPDQDGKGVNVWQPNGRRWSEALVAQDKSGRILFCFTRTPFEMADLNDRLLASGLEIVRAMHVEGGPEASLSLRLPGLTADLMGSYETDFLPKDTNQVQWDLPNVLGVR
ncbi:MAG: phosphodiester glycosidase family protein [Deltaproteobacteria bacterium]|nr:phosphodiester glycosidase family protein [Deltaproteobacteria bacterium]